MCERITPPKMVPSALVSFGSSSTLIAGTRSVTPSFYPQKTQETQRPGSIPPRTRTRTHSHWHCARTTHFVLRFGLIEHAFLRHAVFSFILNSQDEHSCQAAPDPELEVVGHRSRELYDVPGWGQGYFSVSEQGHLQVHPTKDPARAVDLKRLVDRLQLRGLARRS